MATARTWVAKRPTPMLPPVIPAMSMALFPEETEIWRGTFDPTEKVRCTHVRLRMYEWLCKRDLSSQCCGRAEPKPLVPLGYS